MADKRWIDLSSNAEMTKTISELIGIHPVVSQIIINRGLTTVEDIQRFLFPTYEDLHDPFLLNDMLKAVTIILEAIKNNKKIVFYGDFDVDGVTSTTILMLFFRTFYKNIDFYIPLRFNGYGLNKVALKEIKDNGADLVVSVDCGITAVAEVEYCKEIGLDIIVTDHHEPSAILPDALAVVNPMREDNTYPYQRLAGVGVAYKLAVALQSRLNLPHFSKDVRELLDICAFGTVADVMPLTGENRVIVKYGLELMNNKENRRSGLRELLEVAGIADNEVTATTIGFQLAPRINALGRMRDVREAVELFLTENTERAYEISTMLNDENKNRQAIQEEMVKEALAMLPPPEEYDKNVIVLGKHGWHTGIKGIVASKIMEVYYKPVIMCAFTEEGVSEGSARCIEGMHIRKALDECSDLLIGYGGHAAAAGLKLKIEDMDTFRDKLNEVATRMLKPEDLIPMVKYDASIGLEDITFDIIDQLDYLAPFGTANPSPRFVLKGLQVVEAKAVGKEGKHLKLKVQKHSHVIEGIAFQFGHLAEPLQKKDSLIDLVCAIGINEFAGKQSLQLEIKDIKVRKKQGNPYLDRMSELFDEADAFSKDSKYANIGENDEFNTKIVGVSFYDRQDLIQKLMVGDQVYLEREPSNEIDPNAIKVVCENGEQIGYLKSKLAKVLTRYIDKGQEYKVHITNISRIEDDKTTAGVNIVVKKKDAPEKEASTLDINYRSSIEEETEIEILQHIKKKLLGKHDYRPKQSEAIAQLLYGHSVSVIMGTGRGKSAIFQTVAAYKAIKEKKTTIILYPLRALVNDQLASMQEKFAPLGITVLKGTGDLTSTQKVHFFNDLSKGKVDIILTTPEFLYHYRNKFERCADQIGFVVVDEGHHMGKATETYRPIYKKINEISDFLKKPLFAVMTATCEEETFSSICNQLNIEKLIIDPNIRTNLTLVDKRDIKQKEKYIAEIIENGDKTIIYVNSREKTVEIANKLKTALPYNKEEIGFYHAGLTAEDRLYVEQMFREGHLTTIVSTSAFGEGVDIPDIRHVIHYHMPFNEIEFNQESGRAGRNGEKAYVHLLFGWQDVRINDFILKGSSPDRDMLVKIYGYFRRITNNGTQRAEVSLEMSEEFFKANYPDDIITNRTIFTAIAIFKELEIIDVQEGSDIYFIKLLPQTTKMDLHASVFFEEGQTEKEEYEIFKDWVMNSDSKTLLYAINRPIYPTALLPV